MGSKTPSEGSEQLTRHARRIDAARGAAATGALALLVGLLAGSAVAGADPVR
jgi:hypothetical protein